MIISYELGYNKVPLGNGTIEAPIAVDTETDILNRPDEINNLALISASDGFRTILVHPDEIESFIYDHRKHHMVFHNFSYDYWVIRKELLKRSHTLASLWLDRVNQNLNHDTMILDGLVRIAQGKAESSEEDEDKFYMRGLGEVSKEYAGIILDKSDPYRKRYFEIIGKKFDEIKDKGYWEYAAKDAYATVKVWPTLYRLASEISIRYSSAYGNREENLAKWNQYGVLTEQIQIKGALALSQIERIGMPFSLEKVDIDEKIWREKIKESIKIIDKLRPNFFKKKNGRMEFTKKSHTPSINQGDLIVALSDAGMKIKEKIEGFLPPQSTGKLEGMSKKIEDWEPYAKYDEVLKEWLVLADATKRLSFYNIFKPPVKDLFSELEPEPPLRIRSRIDILKLTGRVSYKDPNLQQMPRDPVFRANFKTEEGTKLITVDYSFIELRTLAATCLHQVGYSVMADVIKKGIDPHAYTASMLKKVSLDEFLSWKKDPDKASMFKEARQAAKALNFGIPGGLGAAKLVTYAAANYGVIFTIKEAEDFRKKIVHEVYPELNETTGYLSDDTIRTIALNTGLSKGEIEILLPGDGAMKSWIGRVLVRLAYGATCKKDGDPYDPDFFEKCWECLYQIGKKIPKNSPLSEKSRKKLLLKTGDWELGKELVLGQALTLTGRVRSKVRYTAARNTPFQGLAADGAKLALWKLVSEDYKVCAFIHDEIVVEEVESKAEATLHYVEKVMQECMASVLDNTLPIGTEGSISDAWSK